VIRISKVVEEIIKKDDLVIALASRRLLNASAYAREIQPEIENILLKEVKLGSIVAAINRYSETVPEHLIPTKNIIQSLAVHSNLEGVSYERTEETSKIIREVYKSTEVDNKTYVTVTQGINEITVVAESSVLQKFKEALKSKKTIYYKSDLIGITVKFDIACLETPNIMYGLMRRMALKDINLIEVVSTATELTFIIDKSDLQIGLEQLQKSI
jgi:pyruvoyl-dependent arginine decarboxylase (PvlArgDC)